MRKQLVITIFQILISVYAYAQPDILSDNSGQISFFSKAPLEDIDAHNYSVISSINRSTGEVSVRVPVNKFRFRNSLMQQHFNERYMESQRFPYAYFKGKLDEPMDFSRNGDYTVSASGILNIHGISRKRTIKGVFHINERGINFETKFEVMLADHKIRIPKLVFNKIAERIEVSSSFSYLAPAK